MFRALMLHATAPSLISFPPSLLAHSPESFILDIQMKWFRLCSHPSPSLLHFAFFFASPHHPYKMRLSAKLLFAWARVTRHIRCAGVLHEVPWMPRPSDKHISDAESKGGEDYYRLQRVYAL
jgi:hypothetical protein